MGDMRLKWSTRVRGRGCRHMCHYFVCWLPDCIMDCRCGDAVVMCSFIRMLILTAGLLTCHTHIFSSLMITCFFSSLFTKESQTDLVGTQKINSEPVTCSVVILGCGNSFLKSHIVCDGVPDQADF